MAKFSSIVTHIIALECAASLIKPCHIRKHLPQLYVDLCHPNSWTGLPNFRSISYDCKVYWIQSCDNNPPLQVLIICWGLYGKSITARYFHRNLVTALEQQGERRTLRWMTILPRPWTNVGQWRVTRWKVARSLFWLYLYLTNHLVFDMG